MSAAGASHEAHDAHGHDHHGGHDHASHDDGTHDGTVYHGTMKHYLVGFSLSVILTAIPFWIIMGDVFRSPVTAVVVVMIFAVAQIFVHMVYFLHMNPRSEGGWNMLAAIFTIVIVVIALSGSLWVMSHLHHNMAPRPEGGHEMGGPPAAPAPAKPPHE